jgi:secreted trypsin-like serine protease
MVAPFNVPALVLSIVVSFQSGESLDHTARVQSRIVRGINAEKGRFPYFVSLADGAFFHKCGGSLIAPDLVLTAANCEP